MSDSQSVASEAVPPHAQLIQMATGKWVAAIVYAAAKLGIADHLADGPRSAMELFGATRTHAPSLLLLLDSVAGRQYDSAWRQKAQRPR